MSLTSLRIRFGISIAVYFALPAYTAVLGLTKESGSSYVIVALATSWLWIFLVGRCDVMGYWFRFALLALVMIAFFLSLGALWCLIAGFSIVAAWMLLRRRPKSEEFLDLAFPFQSGVYYVAHGGASSILNHHYRIASQRFALDLVRIHWAGFPARGIFPKELRNYFSFGQAVHSPCNGLVTGVVDDVEDLPVPLVTRERIAGNHVVIQVDGPDTYVGLAHLRKGSVTVKPGEKVTAGQILGQVGNSGNTYEPHLHIHAKKGGRPDNMLDGAGLPIMFRGRWLIRNSMWYARWRNPATARVAASFAE